MESIDKDISLMLGKKASGKKRINSYRKGSSYERDMADIFSNAFGIEIKRVPMSGAFSSVNQSDFANGDLMPIKKNDFFPFCIECKHHNKNNIVLDTLNRKKKENTLLNWIDQCEGDAGRSYKIPLIVFRLNRSADYIIFPYKYSSSQFKDIEMSAFLKDPTLKIMFPHRGKGYIITIIVNYDLTKLYNHLKQIKFD